MDPPRVEAEHQDQEDTVVITLSRSGKLYPLTLPRSQTLSHLASRIEDEFQIPATSQKLIVPKIGLLRPPFDGATDRPLASLEGTKILLLGTSAEKLASFQREAAQASARHASRAIAAAAPPRPRPRAQPANPDHTLYTFLSIRPLNVLPRPERSLAMLQRLAADPGIRAVMQRHRFTVGLLTEMEPLAYTASDHQGTTRILGLNRNQGEVIELRLRTDAHDGYRDYATVRRTLCHELAHNVHGPHDSAFWDLCGRIEHEVEAGTGGRTLDGSRYYAPARDEPDEMGQQDHGGWVGGEYVLGRGRRSAISGTRATLSRREILAMAAMQRAHRVRQAEQAGADAEEEEPGET